VKVLGSIPGRVLHACYILSGSAIEVCGIDFQGLIRFSTLVQFGMESRKMSEESVMHWFGTKFFKFRAMVRNNRSFVRFYKTHG